jgi:hypothetical protein
MSDAARPQNTFFDILSAHLAAFMTSGDPVLMQRPASASARATG